MASTENIEAKLCAYVEGDLDAEGRAEIERHLSANPQHRALLAELVAMRALVRGLPRETAPEDIAESIQGHLERSVLLDESEDEDQAVAGRISHTTQLMALAAIVLLALGLAGVIYSMLPGSSAERRFAIDRTGTDVTLESTTPPAQRPADTMAARAPATGGETSAESDRITIPTPSDPMAIGLPTGSLMREMQEGQSDFAAAAAPVTGGSHDIFTVPAIAGLEPITDLQDKLRSLQARYLRDDATNVAPTMPLARAGRRRQQQGVPSEPWNEEQVVVVVTSNDPIFANTQITNYLADQKIAWEVLPGDAPEPLQLQAQKQMMLSPQHGSAMRQRVAGEFTQSPASDETARAEQDQVALEQRGATLAEESAAGAEAMEQLSIAGNREQMIVAKRVPRSQIVELQNRIERQPGVQRAALFAPLDDRPRPMEMAVPTTQPGVVISADAVYGTEVTMPRPDRSELRESAAGAGGATQSLSQPEMAESGRTRANGPMPMSTAGTAHDASAEAESLDRERRAMPPTTAPTTQAVSFLPDEQQREAGPGVSPEQAITSLPTTMPAAGLSLEAGSADDVVDVVIVVQEDGWGPSTQPTNLNLNP